MPNNFAGAFAAALVLLPLSAMAQDGQPIAWSSFIDEAYDFSVDLPLGLFEPMAEATSEGMTLANVSGEAQLSVYGGAAPGLTIDQFAQRLSTGEQVRTITYRAKGQSWFVLSGDYAPDRDSAEPLIFYTKVLLSPDGNSFSAFEISYPRRDKPRYDPVVERIEDSLTRPGAAS